MKKITILLFALLLSCEITAETLIIGNGETIARIFNDSMVEYYTCRPQVMSATGGFSDVLAPSDKIISLDFSIAGDNHEKNLLEYVLRKRNAFLKNSGSQNTLQTTKDQANFQFNYIDEVSSSCSPTTGLAVDNVTSYGANIFWNDMSGFGAVGYEYAITTSETPPASGTPIITTSTLISGLVSQTTYYLHVRTECAGNTYSTWNTISFTTLCSSVTSFAENFDTVTIPNFPTCWEIVGGTGIASIQNSAPSSSPNHMSIYGFSNTDTVTVSMKPVSNLGDGTHRIKFDMSADFGLGGIVEFGYLTNPENDLTFVPLTSFTASSFSYTSFQFAPPMGVYSEYLAFRHIGEPANGVFIDNVVWEPVPVCPDQTGLVVDNISATGANASWDDMFANGVVGYEYAITTSANPPVFGTVITSPFFNAVGLTPQTVYYLHVRPECAGNTNGIWVSTTFTTSCSEVTSFAENFDTVTTPDFPNCWAKNGDEGFASTQASSSSSVPNAMYIYGDSPTNRAVVVMQPVSNLGDGTHRIKFDLRGDFVAGDDVEFGYLTDFTDNSTFVVLTSFNAASITYENVQFAPPVGLYSNYMAFRHAGNLGLGILIDNVVWEQIPACADQTGLVIANVTATGLDFSWDDLSGNGVVGYEYAITTSVTPPASGISISNTFYSASGLTSQTVYYLHIRSECTGNTYGSWSTISFTTDCSPIASLPWIESFDTITIPEFPPCWIQENGDWETDITNEYNTPRSGINYLKNSSLANNEYVWTPGFDLIAGTSYDFSSWIQGDGFTGWVVDYFVNTSQTSTSAIQVGGQYTVPGNGTLAIQPYAFVTRSFVPAASGVYYFAVRVNQMSGTPRGISLDDVELKLSPVCPNPSLSASNITSINADLNWDTIISPTLGYEYVLDNINTNPSGSGISTMATSYSAIGLDQLTTYYFHVRSVCSMGVYSPWSTISFTTNITPPQNDNLCNAKILTVGTPTGITNTLVGATAQVNEPIPTCFNDGINGSVWFSFVAPASGSVEITTDFVGGTLQDGDTEISVYDSSGVTCSDLSTLAADLGCDQDSGINVDYSSLLSIGGLIPGNSYYIQVDRWSIGVTAGSFGIQVTDVLSSGSFDEESLVVYPNPVKDILNLSYKSIINNVRVVNLLGQEVLNYNVNDNNVEVNMSNLSAGTYVVNITVDEIIHSVKVIKE